jgi:hypothetical protein
MKYRQQITQVRVAYVMMVHSTYTPRSSLAQSAARSSILCRDTRVSELLL